MPRLTADEPNRRGVLDGPLEKGFRDALREHIAGAEKRCGARKCEREVQLPAQLEPTFECGDGAAGLPQEEIRFGMQWNTLVGLIRSGQLTEL